jgi:hypothetical protein
MNNIIVHCTQFIAAVYAIVFSSNLPRSAQIYWKDHQDMIKLLTDP